MHLSNIIYNLWILLPVSITAFNITLLNEQSTAPYNLIIVIVSQNYEYHSRIADENKRTIQYEALLLNRRFPTIHVSHRDFPDCYVPTLKLLAKLWHAYADMKNTWIFIIEENTRVNLEKLYGVLDRYNSNEEFWMGHAIRHETFEFVLSPMCNVKQEDLNVAYSDGATGIAMTTKLLKRISKKWHLGSISDMCFWTTWNTYRYKDIAYFIWNRANKFEVIHEPSFCMRISTDCATYPLGFEPCGQPVHTKHLYFAVSTCRDFHKIRLPVAKKTWAKFADTIRYFSDYRDEDIPTIFIDYPSQRRGFCEKSNAMLQYIKDEISQLPDIRWILVLDDDTTISVYRLRELLSCYDFSKPVAIGELMYCPHNYNFLTGGAGRVLSRSLLEKFDAGVCKCPGTHDFAEDWNMGKCFTALNFTMVHSPRFHSMSSVMYHESKLQKAITFHEKKPEVLFSIYNEWLSLEDSNHSTILPHYAN